jgi:hypothetical protein
MSTQPLKVLLAMSFPVLDEVALLGTMMQALHDVVDYFIVTEADMTVQHHTPRRLVVQTLLRDLSQGHDTCVPPSIAAVAHKIVYVPTTLSPAEKGWAAGIALRQCTLQGVAAIRARHAEPCVIVTAIADADEIITPASWATVRAHCNLPGLRATANMHQCYYDPLWTIPQVCKTKFVAFGPDTVLEADLAHIRNRTFPPVMAEGWHLQNFVPPSLLITKFADYLHGECRTWRMASWEGCVYHMLHGITPVGDQIEPCRAPDLAFGPACMPAVYNDFYVFAEPQPWYNPATVQLTVVLQAGVGDEFAVEETLASLVAQTNPEWRAVVITPCPSLPTFRDVRVKLVRDLAAVETPWVCSCPPGTVVAPNWLRRVAAVATLCPAALGVVAQAVDGRMPVKVWRQEDVRTDSWALLASAEFGGPKDVCVVTLADTSPVTKITITGAEDQPGTTLSRVWHADRQAYTALAHVFGVPLTRQVAGMAGVELAADGALLVPTGHTVVPNALLQLLPWLATTATGAATVVPLSVVHAPAFPDLFFVPGSRVHMSWLPRFLAVRLPTRDALFSWDQLPVEHVKPHLCVLVTQGVVPAGVCMTNPTTIRLAVGLPDDTTDGVRAHLETQCSCMVTVCSHEGSAGM